LPLSPLSGKLAVISIPETRPMQPIPPHLPFFAPFFLLFAIIGIFIAIIPYWFIFKKAGFSPWFGLLMVVPLINLIILYVLAFSQWKVVPITTVYP
jgi:hypothetical protein